LIESHRRACRVEVIVSPFRFTISTSLLHICCVPSLEVLSLTDFSFSQSSSSHTLPKRGEDSKSSGSPRAQSAYTLTTPNNSKPPEPSTAQSNDMFSKPAPTTPQRSAVSDLLKTREREEPGRMVPPRKVATAENGGKGDDSKKSGATRPVRGSTLDNQMKRLQIINEILNTEQAYYDDLQVLLNVRCYFRG